MLTGNLRQILVRELHRVCHYLASSGSYPSLKPYPSMGKHPIFHPHPQDSGLRTQKIDLPKLSSLSISSCNASGEEHHDVQVQDVCLPALQSVTLSDCRALNHHCQRLPEVYCPSTGTLTLEQTTTILEVTLEIN